MLEPWIGCTVPLSNDSDFGDQNYSWNLRNGWISWYLSSDLLAGLWALRFKKLLW